MSHAAQDPGRERFEKPMDGPQDSVQNLERSREKEQEIFGPPDTYIFRDQLPHDDVHRRDEKERQNSRHPMDDHSRDVDAGEKQDE
jgi:hypothetical protein